jgi:nucleotide-binding universal stress UspA family protein
VVKKILFASDFSKSADNAFAYLKALISGRDIQVDLIHVYDIPVKTATSIPHNAIQGMLEEKKEAAINNLMIYREQLEEHQKGKVYPIYGVYPSTEIAEAVEIAESDLIVTALRQKYSIVDRLMGSVTAHTIQKSRKPVLTIPNGATYAPIENILFPTMMTIDDRISKPEEEALEWLGWFCDMISCPKIHLIHVTKDVEKDAIPIVFNNQPFPKMDFIVSNAESIEQGILEQMNKAKIDLLTFYKPNRSLWERIYHSSVTRKLLYKARIPLLIFS